MPLGGNGSSYTAAFGDALIALAEARPEIVAITAGMPGSTGLLPFAERFPDRCFDVGIAEQHAVTAGRRHGHARAAPGRRGLLHVPEPGVGPDRSTTSGCTALPVVFCLDRAGITGDDGPSHHGLYDLALLTKVPGLTLFAPSSYEEVAVMLEEALRITSGPVALRWPKTPARHVAARRGRPRPQRPQGPRRRATCASSRSARWSRRPRRPPTLLDARDVHATVWDVRAIPARPAMLADARRHPLVVTAEDGIAEGGVGRAARRRARRAARRARPRRRRWRSARPPRTSRRASPPTLLANLGLDGPGIAAAVAKLLDAALTAGDPHRCRDRRRPRAVVTCTATHHGSATRGGRVFIDGFVHQLPDIDPQETGEWLDSLDAVIDDRRPRPRPLPPRPAHGARPRAGRRRARDGHRPTTSTRSRPSRSRGSPATRCSSAASAPYIRWNAMAMVDRVEPPLRRPRRPPLHVRVGGRALRRRLQPLLPRQGRRRRRRPGLLPGSRRARASTPARSSKGASPRSTSTASGARSTAAACRSTRTRGACPTSGSSRRSRWASARSTRSPRRASTATCMHREIADTSKSKVWAFVGDGEMDEPEAMAGLSIAAREQLDNLIFVVNCNLQRLDGPVRGNGKIIQELEAIFRGAGWNVIKVIWGRGWDELLARDVDGVLVNKMNSTVDGEFQKYAVESGAYIREHFFGPDPRLQQHGRAPHRRRPAQAAARRPRLPQALRRLQDGGRARGQPDRDPGQDGEGLDARRGHRGAQRHPPDQEARPPTSCSAFRDRLQLPIPDSELDDGDPPFCHPGTDSPEFEYMMARRRALGGSVPERVVRAKTFVLARHADDRPARSPTCSRAPATRCRRAPRPRSPGCCATCCATPTIGNRIVPIIPDEARTFGLDALFREFKIYAPFGQRYEPVDAELLLSYREASERPHPRGGDHRGRLDGDASPPRARRTRRGASR